MAAQLRHVFVTVAFCTLAAVPTLASPVSNEIRVVVAP